MAGWSVFVSFEKRGDGKAVQRAVDSATHGSIIMSFDVEAEGTDRKAVINVTPLFTNDVPEFSASRLVGGPDSRVDSSRSYVEEVKAFPTNIETRSLLTFGAGSGRAPATPGAPTRRGGASSRQSVTLLIHYRLAANPRRPF